MHQRDWTATVLHQILAILLAGGSALAFYAATTRDGYTLSIFLGLLSIIFAVRMTVRMNG